MASSTQDEEEVHHRKEEDALAKEPDLDLNKEAKHEDDDKIVASESETREAKKQKVEQEVKDADQEDESRGATTMVPSTTTPRSLTQEEAKLSRAMQQTDPKAADDERREKNKLSHSGLSLSNSQVRKKFQQLLEESGKNERRFSVYGPDGKVHEIWLGKERTSSFGLTIGWWRFVVEYWLKEWCNFVTVWMFRHRVTQRICLAIDVTMFAFWKQVSKRISQAAFEDSD
ncbi:putative B3 domain-containing protein At4g03160 [Brassica rapa]|uniref:putative B3 domain-containing protein At4g03160 n=1 Tax=Brassica campestris TaxID=3711 RepID=UPI00142D3A3A|nr:putative B3 domain-containing protein At4g03160 [Brassica rapa]